MRDTNELARIFDTFHGKETPIWTREEIRDWVAERDPRWMFLSTEDLEELVADAVEAEQAEASNAR